MEKGKDSLDDLFRAKLHDWEAAPSDQALAKFRAHLGQQTDRPRWGIYLRFAAVLFLSLTGGWLAWQVAPTQPQAVPPVGQVTPAPGLAPALSDKAALAHPSDFSKPVQPNEVQQHLVSEEQPALAVNIPNSTAPLIQGQSDGKPNVTKPADETKAGDNLTKAETGTVMEKRLDNEKPDPDLPKLATLAAPEQAEKIQIIIKMGTEASSKDEIREEQEQRKKSRTGMGKFLARINGGEDTSESQKVEIELMGVSKDSLFKKKDKKNR